MYIFCLQVDILILIVCIIRRNWLLRILFLMILLLIIFFINGALVGALVMVVDVVVLTWLLFLYKSLGFKRNKFYSEWLKGFKLTIQFLICLKTLWRELSKEVDVLRIASGGGWLVLQAIISNWVICSNLTSTIQSFLTFSSNHINLTLSPDDLVLC